jgi:hypothetical protein
MMSMKRWLFAIGFLFVFIGLIIILGLQWRIDIQVAKKLLSKVENRFGILISFNDADVSLTSVIFKNFRISPEGEDKPFVNADELRVGFQLGLFFFRKFDITEIEVDRLELRVGKKAKGASLREWQSLLHRLTGMKEETGSNLLENNGKKRRKSKIHIASNNVVIKKGDFVIDISGLNGKVNRSFNAVIEMTTYEINRQNRDFCPGPMEFSLIWVIKMK